jgi:hypothetical protein
MCLQSVGDDNTSVEQEPRRNLWTSTSLQDFPTFVGKAPEDQDDFVLREKIQASVSA